MIFIVHEQIFSKSCESLKMPQIYHPKKLGYNYIYPQISCHQHIQGNSKQLANQETEQLHKGKLFGGLK